MSSSTPVTIVLTAIVTTGAIVAYNKFTKPTPIPGPPSDNPTKKISKGTAEKLMIGKNQPAVVFSIDRSGGMQAYIVEGTKSETLQFPLPAGTITSMQTITTFETTNPKKCWTDSTGALRCVIWD